MRKALPVVLVMVAATLGYAAYAATVGRYGLPVLSPALAAAAGATLVWLGWRCRGGGLRHFCLYCGHALGGEEDNTCRGCGRPDVHAP